MYIALASSPATSRVVTVSQRQSPPYLVDRAEGGKLPVLAAATALTFSPTVEGDRRLMCGRGR